MYASIKFMNISWIKTFKISIYLLDDKAVYGFILTIAPAQIFIQRAIRYFGSDSTSSHCRLATCQRRGRSCTRPWPPSSGSQSRRLRSSEQRTRRQLKPSRGFKFSSNNKLSWTLWKIISCEYFISFHHQISSSLWGSETLLNAQLFTEKRIIWFVRWISNK